MCDACFSTIFEPKFGVPLAFEIPLVPRKVVCIPHSIFSNDKNARFDRARSRRTRTIRFFITAETMCQNTQTLGFNVSPDEIYYYGEQSASLFN